MIISWQGTFFSLSQINLHKVQHKTQKTAEREMSSFSHDQTAGYSKQLIRLRTPRTKPSEPCARSSPLWETVGHTSLWDDQPSSVPRQMVLIKFDYNGQPSRQSLASLALGGRVTTQRNTHTHTHGERNGTEWSDGGEADVGLRVCAVKGWQHSSSARLDWVGKMEGQQQQENPIIGCPLSLGSVADDDLRGISVRNTLALASRQTFLWHFFVVARDPGLRRRNLSGEYYSSKTKQNNVHRS